MKKLALSAILGASLMISSSAFALTSMTAGSMKSATAQAGVSIGFDGIIIEEFIGATTYTDEDGAIGGLGGSIVISDRHTLKGYYALPNDQGIGATTPGVIDDPYYHDAFAGAVTAMGGNLTSAQVLGVLENTHALTIDVGICSILSVGNYLNSTGGDPATITAAAMTSAADAMTGVVIGLPTAMITTTADSYSVGVSSTNACNNNNADFIAISQGASAMAILGGSVEIAAH
ncbi:MAG: DUF6160 family protein [Desulfobacteraceae bacterium]